LALGWRPLALGRLSLGVGAGALAPLIPALADIERAAQIT
jgi:hypothetical protein